MPIKVSFDEINTASTKIGEVHGVCDLIYAEDYKSERTKKHSVRFTFRSNGSDFYAFSGVSENALRITEKQILRILVKAVGEEKAKDIFNDCCNDEDVNDEVELALALAVKLGKKLKNSPIQVNVDRTKDGDFWNVKWRLADEKPAESAAHVDASEPKKSEPLTQEDFWKKAAAD